MPPAPWRHGQRASLLMIPGGGETLGAAVLAQAPGTCPQLGGWWFHVGRAGKEHRPSSNFFSGASGPRCCSATKMQMSQKVADIICLFFFFFLKVIFESPSHSCLPTETFIHFPSNGNFFFTIMLHCQW